jgi:hypothetical protein
MSSAGLYLDSEWTLASFVSAGILLAAALAAGALAVAHRGHRGEVWPIAGLGFFFGYMATDELFGIHERFDVLFGPAGVALFGPILLTGFLLWYLTRRRLDGVSRHLFSLAAATWVGSQALELLANPPAGAGIARGVLVFPEEIGEAVGSAIFLAALIVALLPKLSPSRIVLRRRTSRRKRESAFA